MNPDRWQKLKAVFEGALNLTARERAEFLARECADDPELRREVEALISGHAKAGDFIEEPAAKKMAGVILDESKSRPGQSIDQLKTRVAKSRRATDLSASEPIRKHPFFWVVVFLAAVEFGCFVYSGVLIYRYGTQDRPLGWVATDRNGKWFIDKVDSDGPAAGRLQTGDQILAVNDDTRMSLLGPRLKLRSVGSDQIYTVLVRRGTTEQLFTVTRPPARRVTQNLGYVFSVFAIALIFFMVAILAGVLKPGHRVAQTIALAWFGTTLVVLARSLDPLRFFFHGNEVIFFYLIALIDPFHLALSFHAFHFFPSGAVPARFWSWLKNLFYVWGAIIDAGWAWLRWPGAGTDEARIATAFSTYRLSDVWLKGHLIFLVVCSLAGCAVLINNYRKLPAGDERRRVKWVIYGLLAAVLPVTSFFLLLAVGVGGGFLSLNSGNVPLLTWWWLSLLAIGVMPVIFGYALLTRRISDINIVVRRGVQYLLAKNVLRVLLALPIIGLAYTIFVNRNVSLMAIVTHNPLLIVLIAAAAVGLVFRKQLSRIIDRRFFREAYNQEQILLRLIDQVKQENSLAQVAELVTEEVEAALHPSRIEIFYRDADAADLKLGHSSAGDAAEVVPGGFRLLRFMEDQGGAQEFPFPPKNNLPAGEKDWLAERGVALLVPMCGSESRLVGLMLLGEKKSEAPYGATDRRLLEAIATQIAIVCENLSLKSRSQAGEQRTLAPPSKLVGGRYLVERLLGEGGMGKIFLARDRQLDRPVALKFLPAELANDQKRISRFFREAKAASALNHPNIVTVHEVGESNGQYFIATEYVRGVTLRERMANGRMEICDVLDVIMQIGSALSAAHAAGIVHRDIKPENVMIRPDGYAKVLDFGLAKLTASTTDSNPEDATRHLSQTEAGLVMGTVRYMSPEQARALAVDARTDIWSLGVVLYEMLSGKLPFAGQTLTDTLAAILNSDPAPLALTRTDVSEELQTIVLKTLRKDRADRYATIDELVADLTRVKDELDIAAKMARASVEARN